MNQTRGKRRSAPHGRAILKGSRIVSSDPAFCALLGYDNNLEIDLSDLCRSEIDAEAVLAAGKSCLSAKNHSIALSITWTTQMGTPIDVTLHIASCPNEPATFNVIAFPILSSEEMALLQRNETMFSAILDHAPIGIGLLVKADDGSRVIGWQNPAMDKLYGYSRAETLGRSSRILYDNDDDYTRTGEFITSEISKNGVCDLTKHFYRKDRTPIHIRLIVMPVPLNDETALLVIAEDVSERHNAMQNLEKREKTLDSILRAAPIGIGMLQGETILWQNKTMDQLTGYPRGELVGRTPRCLWPNESSYIQAFAHLHDHSLENGTVSVEATLIKKDKSMLDVGINFASTDTSDPSAPTIVALEDLSEVKKLKSILEEENTFLREEMIANASDTIIGAEFGLRNVVEQVRQVAPLESSVFLYGETGVGKEIIANVIHRYSGRNNRPFIKVNCGAIPESLIDSELFGHEKGAFTGALKQRKGRFERAQGGTIFLDEIGELPLSAQVRLLRVLQTKEIERVGGDQSIPLDVRVIAATHRDLEKMVESETFREDLLYRLTVFPISIPPLRHRLGDLPALVHHFIKKKSATLNLRRDFEPAPRAIEEMMKYNWPGNVRELENVVEREIIRASAKPDERYLYFGPMPKQKKAAKKSYVDSTILTLDKAMIRHIQTALIHTEGRVEGKGGAAEILGINPATLRGRMRKLGIKFGRKANEN